MSERPIQDELTHEQLKRLSPLDAAIVVASNLSQDRPWEIEQRRLDLLGYLRQARREIDMNLRERLLAFLKTPCPRSSEHSLALGVLGEFYCQHCGRVAA